MAPTNSLADSWTAGPVGRVAAPLREQVIAALRQAILDFQLKPGQRLVERELIEQLGVSRTTIREALRELTSEGLVTVIPQRGAMVSVPSIDEAADLYEVRASLESLLVRRFVERASDREIDELQGTIDRLAGVVEETEDTRRILAAKDGFYAVLINGARSSALQQLIEGIQARVQVLRATSLSTEGRPHEMVAELQAVVDAIRQRDAELGSRLCADHVHKAAATALSNLGQAEPEDVDEVAAV